MRRRGLLLAALLVASVAVVPAVAQGERDARCNGAARLCDRRLDRVVLPGAHNAMSAQSLGFELPNQSVGIPGQLETGIRALLIDTHYGISRPDGTVATADDQPGAAGRRPYLCHVRCEIGASPLVPVLRSIRRFLRRHPNNVVTIVVEDKVSPADFAAAVRDSGLLDYVYRGPPGPRWLRLETMIARRQQVVMLAEHQGGGTAYPWLHSAYDGIVQETRYTWQTPNQITDPASWADSCAPNRGDGIGSLFLLNHWSPPTAPATPDVRASAAVNSEDVIFGRARACRRLRGRLPSIIAVDQFAVGGLFAAVRRLNGVRR